LSPFFTWLTTALSLLLVDLVVPGVNIATFPAALIAAISIGLSIQLLSQFCHNCPYPSTLSLGLFSIVVNGVSFWLAAVLVPGFSVHGLLGAILGPIVLSFVNTF